MNDWIIQYLSKVQTSKGNIVTGDDLVAWSQARIPGYTTNTHTLHKDPGLFGWTFADAGVRKS